MTTAENLIILLAFVSAFVGVLTIATFIIESIQKLMARRNNRLRGKRWLI